MRKSKIRAKMRSDQPVRIAFLGHYVPSFIAYAARAGYDGLWLDLEHHPMEPREIQSLLAFAHLYDIDCLIRPATREKAPLYRYLEDGASGLIIPHVSEVETARELVNKVRFPPLGDRGIAGLGLEFNYGLDQGDITAHANSETLLIVQIETVEAVQHIDAIAALPGIDGLYIGPHDLSIRMALTPEAERLEPREVMARVDAACRKHGKAWGTFAVTEATLVAQYRAGARLLVWGADFLLLRQGLEQGALTLDALTQTGG